MMDCGVEDAAGWQEALMNRTRLLALAAATAAVLTAAGTATAGPGPGGDNNTVRSRGVRAAPGFQVLRGVVSISENDALAVGRNGPRASAARWDGSRWRDLQAPGSRQSELLGVAALGTDDAWAVGHAGADSLAEHWSGGAWSLVRTPDPDPGTRDVLTDVSGIATDDVWAVGYTQPRKGKGKIPLVEHWDGTGWQKVSSPALPPHTSAILDGVDVITADDAWAVGGGRYVTLLERWNGHVWKANGRIRGTGGRQVESTGVSALAADDIWSVGTYPGGKSTVMLHWDGTGWTQIHSPNIKKVPLNLVYGVSAVASDDVWAVGCGASADGQCVQTLIEHWDGSEWTQIPSPNPGTTNNGLFAVSADATDNAWAVGYVSDDSGSTSSYLYLHWDGSRWEPEMPAGG
jgi:hypothetical protein